MVATAPQAPVDAAEPRRRVPRLLTGSAALCIGAALYALAFPPFDHAWSAWLTLVPLLLTVRGLRSRGAFLYGAAYGLGCAFAMGSTWLPQAMARFFELPFIVALLGTLTYGLLFWGTAFGLFAAGAVRLCGSRRPILAAVATAALWVATELLRGRNLEQPWGLLGYSQHAQVALIQVSAVTGVYGVSFLLALGNASIAEAVAAPHRRAGRFAPLAVTGALAVAVWGAGGLVMQRDLPPPDRSVAIVQTNVSPAVHWTRAYTDRQVMEDTRATDELVPTRGVHLIVWPENAVARYLEIEPGLAAQLAALARRHGSDLLFGAPRQDDGRSYNSVRLITAAGRNGGYYDKQRLVFVAEANPLRRASAKSSDGDPEQFTAGDRAGVLPSFVPLGVSICHEALFPELTARSVRAGAELLAERVQRRMARSRHRRGQPAAVCDGGVSCRGDASLSRSRRDNRHLRSRRSIRTHGRLPRRRGARRARHAGVRALGDHGVRHDGRCLRPRVRPRGSGSPPRLHRPLARLGRRLSRREAHLAWRAAPPAG